MRTVMHRCMRADRAGHIRKHTVLDQHIADRQILAPTVGDMERMEHIELDRLIAVVAGGEALILEDTAANRQAVHTRELGHVTLLLVENGHVVHREVLDMKRFDDGILTEVAVKGAAEHAHILIRITGHTGIDAVLVADAQHVACACTGAFERHTAQVERRVAVDAQHIAQVILALGDSDRIGQLRRSILRRLIQCGLYRSPKTKGINIFCRNGENDLFLCDSTRGKNGHPDQQRRDHHSYQTTLNE